MQSSLTVFRCGYLLAMAFVLVTLWKPLNEAAKAVEELNYDSQLFEPPPSSVTPQDSKPQHVSEYATLSAILRA